MCKLSILMSIYNEPKRYIVESILSLLNQSFADFECIIIVDNPQLTDIVTIVNSFNDGRLKLIYNENNMGLALSMNRAATIASSPVFARMDADDIAEKDRLEIEYQILNEKNVDVVYANYTFIDSNSKSLSGLGRQFVDGYADPVDIALNPNQIHHPTVMMRRTIFEEVRGYRDFPCAQDSDLWMRMQEAGASFYKVSTPLIKYRINPQSTTQARYFKQSLTTRYIYSLSVERLQNGKDSYSVDNYNNYLKKNGIESELKNKLFKYGQDCLEKAQNCSLPKRILYRMIALIVAPQIRLLKFRK
jgi:glycosyltransferase involved in cell wall biosynthesis